MDALEDTEEDADASCADRRLTLTAWVGTTVPLDELDPPDAQEASDKPEARGLIETLDNRSR